MRYTPFDGPVQVEPLAEEDSPQSVGNDNLAFFVFAEHATGFDPGDEIGAAAFDDGDGGSEETTDGEDVWPGTPIPNELASEVRRSWIATSPLGRASRQALSAEIRRALIWASYNYDPERGTLRHFAFKAAGTAAKRFLRRWPHRKLLAELEDERLRSHVESDDARLVHYMGYAVKRVRRWLRADLSEEMEAEMTAVIIECARGHGFEPLERVGVPVAYSVYNTARTRLRRTLLRVVEGVGDGQLHAFVPGPDHYVLGKERDRRVDEAQATLTPELSKTQARYLEATRQEVDLGPIRGVLTRVATRLDVDKAQSSRAMRKIRKAARRAGFDALDEPIVRKLQTSNPRRQLPIRATFVPESEHGPCPGSLGDAIGLLNESGLAAHCRVTLGDDWRVHVQWLETATVDTYTVREFVNTAWSELRATDDPQDG